MTQRISIEYVSPFRLRPAGFNPDGRILKEALKPLIASIRLLGFVTPIVVANNYEIIDGHRRHAAAKECKLEEIPVIRLPISLQVGWATLNTATMKIDNRSWVQVLAPKDGEIGFDPENAPVEVRRAYKKVVSLIPDGVLQLSRLDMSFGVLDSLSMIKRYCSVSNKDTETQGKILQWLITHRMQYPVRKAIESGISAAELTKAINRDVPLRTTYVAAVHDD